MPEDKSDNKSADVKDKVEREDYNKVVEVANSAKAELEKKEKELKELREQAEEKEKTAKKEDEKKTWEKELAERDKKIAELENAKKVEREGPKGVISNEETNKTEITNQEIKTMLDQVAPDPKVDPKNMGPIDRMLHFKSGRTKHYNDEQFGKMISLSAGAQAESPSLVSPFAKKQSSDIIVGKK